MCVYSHFTLFEKHLQMYKINYKKSQEIKKKAKEKRTNEIHSRTWLPLNYVTRSSLLPGGHQRFHIKYHLHLVSIALGFPTEEGLSRV